MYTTPHHAVKVFFFFAGAEDTCRRPRRRCPAARSDAHTRRCCYAQSSGAEKRKQRGAQSGRRVTRRSLIREYQMPGAFFRKRRTRLAAVLARHAICDFHVHIISIFAASARCFITRYAITMRCRRRAARRRRHVADVQQRDATFLARVLFSPAMRVDVSVLMMSPRGHTRQGRRVADLDQIPLEIIRDRYRRAPSRYIYTYPPSDNESPMQNPDEHERECKKRLRARYAAVCAIYVALEMALILHTHERCASSPPPR